MHVNAKSARTRFGPFELNRSSGELSKLGRRVRLQDQPFQVLLLLLDRPGEVITREELQQQLWRGDTFVDFDHGLNNVIKRLREALGDSAEKPRYVETLPRRGYRFVGELAPDEAEPDSQSGTEDRFEIAPVSMPVQAPHPFPRWTTMLSTTAALSFLLIVGVGARSHPTASPSIRSIAVLPLEDISAVPSQRYFAEGLTDALTAELGQIGSLRVVSRTSAKRYRKTAMSVPQIARELNVEAVVEGSVAREKDHVRVTAQLIQGSTDRNLWASSYDRKLGDVLTLESQVAREIAQQVAATITPDENSRLLRKRTVDPVAYDRYLQALYYAQQLNRADNDRAIALLEQAIALDPQFAPAYSAIAYEYRTRGIELNRGSDEWTSKGFVAAEKCIALDPELADCYVSRATLLWTEGNHFPHESAVADLKHALSLSANADEAHHQLANIYNHVGMLSEAEAQIKKAEELNPSNPGARFRASINLIYQGRYEEALTRIGNSQDFMPSLWAYQTGFALTQLGRLNEAAALLRRSENNDKTETAALLRSMEAVLAASDGDNRKAQQKIAEAIAMGSGFQHFHHTEYGIASAYALMNRHAEALQWLQRAANDGFPCYPLFARDRNLANLRQDPQFLSFMSELQARWQHYRQTL